MKLGAYIDQYGNAFIAKAENTVYLHFDLPEKYTRVSNESGGQDVSVQQIADAISKHEPQGSSVHFDSDETMLYYLEYA